MKKINILLIAGALSLPVGGALASAHQGDVKPAYAAEALFIGEQNMLTNPVCTGSSGTATYDSSSKTLTLDNFVYNSNSGHQAQVYAGNYDTSLYSEGFEKLVVKLKGVNSIRGYLFSSDNYRDVAGAVFNNPVEFTKAENAPENTKLSFTSASPITNHGGAYGCYANGDVTVNGCEVSFSASQAAYKSTGLYVFGSLSIIDSKVTFAGGEVVKTVNSESNGLEVFYNTTVTNSTIIATGGTADHYSCGMQVYNSSSSRATFTNSTITSTGGTTTASSSDENPRGSIGIHGQDIIFNNSVVNATGGTSNGGLESAGIMVYGTCTFNSGKITAVGGTSNSGKSYGLSSYYTENRAVYDAKGDVTLLLAYGKTRALNGKLKNAYDGNGWTNYEGTTGQATIAATSTATTYGDYKRIKFCKIECTVTASDPVTYDGNSHVALTVSVTEPSSGYTVGYKVGSETEYSSTVPAPTDAGTYSINVKIEASGYPTVTKTVSFTINPAEMSDITVVVTSGSFDYDGTAKTPTVETSGKTIFDTDPTFTYSKTQTGTYETTIPSFTDAGTHTIYWKAEATGHKTETGTITFTINPVEMSNVSVTVTSGTFDYDGTPKTPIVETTGKTIFDTDPTFKYSKTETGTYGEMPTFTDAGTHTVYWKAEAAGHVTVTGSFEITIGKAQSSYGDKPTAVTGLAYTGSAQALVNAGTSETGTVMYRLGEEGEFTSTVPSATEVGEYKVYFYVKGDANHLDTEVEYVVVRIDQNSKVVLNSAIDSGNRVYEMLAESNPEAAEALKVVLDDAKAVQADPNVTVTAIDEAAAALLEALVSSVTTLIDDIGEVKYNKDSQEAIENAREAYDLLPEEQKAEVGEEKLEVLTAAEEKYQKLKAAAKSGLPGWAIFLIIFFAIILAFVITYVLLFFVFNKWIKGSREPERVFKLSTNGQRAKLLARNFRVIERFERDIFNTKEEASK